MTDEEIKAKKGIIRARIRAGLRSWKLPAVFVAVYAVLFVVSYFLYRGIGLVVDMPRGFQPFPSHLAWKLAFGVAGIGLAFWVAMFVLLYVLCPVTGPFALKLREPKKG